MHDVLTDVLEVVQIRTTLFAMAALSGQWGVDFPAGSGAYFHVVEGGPAWLHVGSADPIWLAPGDVVLLAHGTAHRVTSGRRSVVRATFDPLTWTPNAVVGPVGPVDSAPRAVGYGGVSLVCGFIQVRDPKAPALLRLLPPVVHVRRAGGLDTDLDLTLRLLSCETARVEPGTQTVLARLGDVLLVQLLRCWLAGDGSADAGWLGALRDPQVGAALAAMHADPAAPWTVDALARVARLSRSRFAERFAEAVGEAPLAYLTRWRLTTAARMIREGGRVGPVGRAVGYGSEPAFSRAFRRHHGYPPSRASSQVSDGADASLTPVGRS